ncbi:MAG: hypothetical protein E6J06_05190 [Chloroflexi bacterium]|nr:MAG: hypothetical protein E6J06_05190 [Chloroflexota bacterium]
MRLDELARGAGAALEGNPEVEVTGIAYDSRRVGPGDLFVAVQGLRVDGHHYIADAVAKGAAAVAVEATVKVPAGVTAVRMASTRIGLAELSAEFYGRPSRSLKLAGITGTDGKTTVTHMAEHVLQASGMVAGAMSTVSFKISGREVDNTSGQTTNEAPEVQAWLARMVEAGAACAVIETTSHALVQERVRACEFDVAAFTNVGHDHIDYHATWEDYLEAKARLIDLTAQAAHKGIEKTAVLNRDDRSYERLAGRPIPRRWTYGMTTASDLHPLELAITGSGSRFRMKTPARPLQHLQRAVRGRRLPRAGRAGGGRGTWPGRFRGRARKARAGRSRSGLSRLHRLCPRGRITRQRAGRASSLYAGAADRRLRLDGAVGP